MTITTPKDINSLVRYLTRISQEFPTEMNISDIKKYAEKLYKYAKVLFLENDFDTLGMVAYYNNDNIKQTVYISSISVIKTFHSRGLGQILLDIVIENTFNSEMKYIKLQVQKTNTYAINFYLNNGFIEDTEDKESIFMTKEITKT